MSICVVAWEGAHEPFSDSWMVISQAWIPEELNQQAKRCSSNSLVRIHTTNVTVRTYALSSLKGNVNVVMNARIGV